MYGVAQFHWFSHTMILWGQMDAMGFLLYHFDAHLIAFDGAVLNSARELIGM
jgi:hypothetical protein